MNKDATGAITILAMLLPGCATPQAPQELTIPVPRLSVGDEWVYDAGDGHEIVRRVTAVAIEAIDGTDYERRTISDGNSTFQQWLRLSDGAMYVYDAHETRDGTFSMSGFEPPCPSYFGRRAIGSPWTNTCNWYWWRYDPASQAKTVVAAHTESRTFVLLGLGEKTGPYGQTTVFHIREIAYKVSDDATETSLRFDIWYSPKFCREVESNFDFSSVEGGSPLVRARCAKGLNPDEVTGP